MGLFEPWWLWSRHRDGFWLHTVPLRPQTAVKARLFPVLARGAGNWKQMSVAAAQCPGHGEGREQQGLSPCAIAPGGAEPTAPQLLTQTRWESTAWFGAWAMKMDHLPKESEMFQGRGMKLGTEPPGDGAFAASPLQGCCHKCAHTVLKNMSWLAGCWRSAKPSRLSCCKTLQEGFCLQLEHAQQRGCSRRLSGQQELRSFFQPEHQS